MAHNFQKIYAPFGRKNSNDRMIDETIISNQTPWVPYLRGLKFKASEKIDGTSVGIVWDGERVHFIGHTDKSQFAPRYAEYLKSRFCSSEFESMVEEYFGEKSVILYGEGISKDYNVHYGFPDGEFILYDIQSQESGNFWDRQYVKEAAEKLGFKYPWETDMTLDEAIEFVKTRPQSVLDSSVKMEGLVLRAPIELTSNGKRVITKVKVKDFVDIPNYKTE